MILYGTTLPPTVKKQLEAIHLEAARIITGATKLCSTEKLLSDLGWDSLQNRRNKHKLTILYKILNGLTPEYLQFILPPLVQNTTNYNLRNSNNLCSIHANTNLFYNSFFPSTIRAWNDLSEDIKNSPSVTAFKYRLNRDTHPPPKYFNAGTRMGQVLHARIRMDCSALNSHYTEKILFQAPHAHVATLRAHITSFSYVQIIPMQEIYIFRVILTT